MQAVYERQAAHFDSERDKSGLEAGWLARFAEHLPAGASILDAGCGTGDPVSRWFIERGYSLTGVDYAPAMVAIAKRRFPQARWRLADLRTLDLGETVDGVLSWHGFFHLSPAEQRIGLERLCSHLKPGAPLLLTVGPHAGEAIGHVGGEPVYHASLDQAGYAAALDAAGFNVVDFVAEDASAGEASVVLARRR